MPPVVLETAKKTNPVKDLLKFGQSVWLDYIRRDLLTGGELKERPIENLPKSYGAWARIRAVRPALADSHFPIASPSVLLLPP